MPSKSSAFCRLARGPILIKIRMHDNAQAESVTERQPHERSHMPARLVPEQRASNPFVAFRSYILKRYTSSVIAVTRLRSHPPLRSCGARRRGHPRRQNVPSRRADLGGEEVFDKSFPAARNTIQHNTARASRQVHYCAVVTAADWRELLARRSANDNSELTEG